MGKVTSITDKQKSEVYREALEYGKLLFDELDAYMEAGFSRDEAFVLVQLGMVNDPVITEQYVQFIPDGDYQ